jgi:hypothetical protein
MKRILIAIAALLTATAGAQEQNLSQEQQDACGAILCLAGGGATAECNPYLKKFYDTDPDDRTDFLNKCPTHGLSQGAIGELARHGSNCSAQNLAKYLNARNRSNDPNAWRICAHYYSELTEEKPPRLVERCQDERDDSGGFEQVCTYQWVTSEYETGSWCKDKDASCKETDVSS